MNEPGNDVKSDPRWLRRWVPGIVLWLLIGAILVGAIYFRPWGRARQSAKQAICGANLNSIGKGIVIYQSEHYDLPPPNLAALVADGQPRDLLICPSSGTEKSPTTQMADVTVHCDYIYAPLPIDAEEGEEEKEEELAMAFELPANHQQDVVNVLFKDYHVEGIQEMDRFVSLVQKLNDYHAKLRRQQP